MSADGAWLASGQAALDAEQKLSYDLIDGADRPRRFLLKGSSQMTKRHRDALGISAGAVNPSGMAHSLVSACRECLDENVAQHSDPAVKLIVSQLAYICGIWDGVSEWVLSPMETGRTRIASDFCACTRECEKKEGEVA